MRSRPSLSVRSAVCALAVVALSLGATMLLVRQARLLCGVYL
jgi:hypothetical protein